MRYVSYRMYRYFLVILAKPYLPVFFSNTGCCYHYPAMCVCVGGEGGGRRGLGSRNDVLTTCKMVTLRGGKRIVFPTVNILIEARSEPEEEKIYKWEKLNHASVFFLHIVFVFWY